jgi:RND family efflux transporter MFP subunit
MERLDVREETQQREAGAPAAERALWAEFAQPTTIEASCRSWLALQCGIIEGVTGGLVLLGPADRGPFAPAGVWPSPRRSMKHLTGAAERALTERRGLLSEHRPTGEPGEPPEPRVHVAYPLEVAGRLHGVVVLEVTPRADDELQAALRQLYWGSAWLEVLLRRDAEVRETAARQRLQTVLDMAALAVGHQRFYAAATAFVTALATALGCDRVSLGFVRARRTHVRAISHTAEVRKRTNLVRAIGEAMDEVLDQRATIVHPPAAGQPARVTRAHAELARQHGTGAVCSIPLGDGGRTFGALTLERSAEVPFDSATVELVEAIGAVLGPILETQRREDRWLVTKAAESGRHLFGRLFGAGHPGIKLGTLAVLAVVVFFALAEGTYRVTAPTVVEPLVKRAVVAPFNGYIAEARVRAGDLVRQGDLLCMLDDRELRVERLKSLAQHEQLVRQFHQALAAHNAAQVAILTAQIDQAKAQLTLLNDQLTRTRVVAPLEGIVVIGDLSQSLGSPVERGQVLFEVAPLDVYRVVLQVDERDISDVSTGQAGHLMLSGMPGEPLPLRIEKLTPVSTSREGRNYFRVEARIETTPGRVRPGMEGVAKVEIDRRHLIWIWTHEVTDWVRLALWSWLP